MEEDMSQRVIHLKRGSTYKIVCRGVVQSGAPLNDYDEVVIYQAEIDGKVWVRPVAEFYDGRFEPIKDESAP